MRANEGRMRPSLCVHCEEAVTIQGQKFKRCYICELDEWDDTTECRKGGCWYYRRREKEEKEARDAKDKA